MMFHLNGDLKQMATQMVVLKERGIKVEVDGGIPFVEEKDYHRALLIIWVNAIHGWWNYKDDFLKYAICTEEQFMKRLKKE
jgi:hypothetical protein